MTAYTYTTIDDPLATFGTVATSINDLGQIVGYYDYASGRQSFLYSDGIYTTIHPTNDIGFTTPLSINASGQITGFYDDASGVHGFLYGGVSYTTIDDPSATNGTYAVRARGEIIESELSVRGFPR